MNSLRELDDLAGRIRLHQQSDKRVALIVEGEDDVIVLQPLLDSPIFPAGGRSLALKASARLLAWGRKGHVAVVDRDFRPHQLEVDGAVAPLAYEGRDLESMLIRFGVVSQALRSFGEPAKLAEFGGADALIERCCAEAESVARIRCYSLDHRLMLPFDRVAVTAFVSWPDLTLDEERYCQALIAKTELSLSAEELSNEASRITIDEFGPRGKDVIEILSKGLARGLLKLSSGVKSKDALGSLALAASAFRLQSSAWFKELELELEAKTVHV
ncbi:hypothetical protein [Agrococcus sp. Marseille-Q4369]|uniref:hypothetical protein n=1 Tax=Agrococcus sp. Marseille-Q4369 TaxID=2810513 RepID=UPI001B8C8882|nr:hypothetical protein [Agrococcus sp. Marseille-Q4369]QUW17894.1 hypothetical protein JSQ78_08460 [Agrococcus sp. Marseille-Q4369]